MAVIESPVREGGASEQGGTFVQGSECLKYKRIRGRGGFDMAGQREVKGIDDHGVGNDGSVSVVPSGIEVVPPR